MTYAFSLANGVWLAGADALGLSVGLKGNGMCFRAAALDRFPWRVHGLVEDMEYAWALRAGRGAGRFQPLARVFGEMVSRGEPAPRRNASAGKVVDGRFGPASGRGLWQSSALSLGRKLAYQTELSFPPLSRLVVGLAVASILGGWGFWVSRFSLPWGVLAGALGVGWVCLLAYVLSPLPVMGLPVRYITSLLTCLTTWSGN